MKFSIKCKTCIAKDICSDKLYCNTDVCTKFHDALESKLLSQKSSLSFPDYFEAQKLFQEWFHKEGQQDTLSYRNMRKFYDIIVGNKKR